MLKTKAILPTLILTLLFAYFAGADTLEKWCKVEGIIDGDTLWISYNSHREKVRLYGIDAPERGENGYFRAAAALEKLCYGQNVRLEFPGKNRRDRYHRLLAKVYLADGRMVNKILYDLGVVKLYKPTPLFVPRP